MSDSADTNSMTPETVSLLLKAFVGGLVAFGILVAYLLGSGADYVSLEPTTAIVLLLVIGGSGAAVASMARKKLAPENATVDPEEAQAARLTITLLQGAITEGFGLMGTVLALISGTPYLLAAPIVSAWILLRLARDVPSAPAGGGAPPIE